MTRAARLALLLALAALAAMPSLAAAQAPATPPDTTAPRPAARPADVESIDAIVKALYESISGPAGHQRDWGRLRSLFHPAARMMPVLPRQGGGFATRVLTPEEYIARSGNMLVQYGFTERELARRTERFANIAHVWSTYEGRWMAEGAPIPPPRGINSIQLVYDGARWWVQSLFWEAEAGDRKLPAQYLK